MTGSQVTRCLFFVSLLTSVSAGSSAATLYTFTTIDVPGANFTQPKGINNAGQIVGEFSDAAGAHGFLKAGATFTTIDVPGADFTLASGINNAGQIVGEFLDSGIHGFLKDGATFTKIDVPGGVLPHALGINDVGRIVGIFSALLENHGFLKDGASFTTIDVPGANFTRAFGINDAGQIVGDFGDATGFDHGFVATPVVPEPVTWLLFGSGLVGLVWWRRRPAVTLISARHGADSGRYGRHLHYRHTPELDISERVLIRILLTCCSDCNRSNRNARFLRISVVHANGLPHFPESKGGDQRAPSLTQYRSEPYRHLGKRH
jgi:hypothetical protein